MIAGVNLRDARHRQCIRRCDPPSLNRSVFVRPFGTAVVLLALLGHVPPAQAPDSTHGDKTFLVKRDLAITGLAAGATALVSIFDDDVALASQQPRYQKEGLTNFALKVSKVNE